MRGRSTFGMERKIPPSHAKHPDYHTFRVREPMEIPHKSSTVLPETHADGSPWWFWVSREEFGKVCAAHQERMQMSTFGRASGLSYAGDAPERRLKAPEWFTPTERSYPRAM